VVKVSDGIPVRVAGARNARPARQRQPANKGG
jgi:hypothetical protein